VNRYPQEIGEGNGQHTYVRAMGYCHRLVYLPTATRVPD